MHGRRYYGDNYININCGAVKTSGSEFMWDLIISLNLTTNMSANFPELLPYTIKHPSM